MDKADSELLDGIALALMTLANSFQDLNQMNRFCELLDDAREIPNMPEVVASLLERLGVHAAFSVEVLKRVRPSSTN